MRAAHCGDEVSYVVTRNINYTNICYFRCKFCAFSKGKLSENLRGRPYDLEPRRNPAARRRSMGSRRGGSLPARRHSPVLYGSTYLSICRAIKDVCPKIHIHAFSPLEIWQGASTLGVSVHAFLGELKDAGLGSLPGTAAEILDDEVRAVICPDKINTAQWLEVIETAHRLGIRTTATIMFGHVDHYRALGAALVAAARAAKPNRRLHRIRAAAVRADGDADPLARRQPARADLSRSRVDARGRHGWRFIRC